MKILFLTYHGFEDASGISKKMLAQIKGLQQNGHEVHVCSYDIEQNGDCCRFVDGEIIQNYGKGKKGAILQRLHYDCVYDYCVTNHIEVVYVRHYMNSNPCLVRLFRRLKRAGMLCVMEIPTYPYDQEFYYLPFKHKVGLFVDRMFRRQLVSQMKAVVTFSGAKTIFGQRTINISNGIDLDALPLHQTVDCSKELHLIGVAEVHPWHGFDRLIQGLGEYYQSGRGKQMPVFFHIVGSVWPAEMNGTNHAPGFAPLMKKYGIEQYVVFHGRLFGDELNAVFRQASFAVGSLARHRSGISCVKTLKNREYAGRGIPFVYSENDSDFDTQPYVLKVKPDETPIDIQAIVDFCHSALPTPAQIRQTVLHLAWKNQMQQVIDSLQNTP